MQTVSSMAGTWKPALTDIKPLGVWNKTGCESELRDEVTGQEQLPLSRLFGARKCSEGTVPSHVLLCMHWWCRDSHAEGQVALMHWKERCFFLQLNRKVFSGYCLLHVLASGVGLWHKSMRLSWGANCRSWKWRPCPLKEGTLETADFLKWS